MEKTNDKFVTSILESVASSKAGFYLALVGVTIQFIHNVLAFAGTFSLFSTNQHGLLVAGEWVLVVFLGFFFAGGLFYFTIKSGSVKVHLSQENSLRESNTIRKKKYNKNLKIFQVFDTLIDIYFWIYIVFLKANLDNLGSLKDFLLDKAILLVVIIPIAIMLPQTIRFYSGEIEH